MEYPLPSTFIGTPVTQLAFLSIPEMVLAFDVQGDSSMTGAWAERFMEDYFSAGLFDNSEQINQSGRGLMPLQARTTINPSRNISSSHPIVINVFNMSDKPEQLVLFNPIINRTAINFGNGSNVLIQEPAEYSKVLAQLENGLVIGHIRISLNRELPNSDASQLPIIKIPRTLPNGGTSTSVFNPSYGISAFQPDLTTIDFSAIIDCWTGLEVIVPAGQQIEVMVFPSQRRIS